MKSFHCRFNYKSIVELQRNTYLQLMSNASSCLKIITKLEFII